MEIQFPCFTVVVGRALDHLRPRKQIEFLRVTGANWWLVRSPVTITGAASGCDAEALKKEIGEAGESWVGPTRPCPNEQELANIIGRSLDASSKGTLDF
jgi:hypothetical protein